MTIAAAFAAGVAVGIIGHRLYWLYCAVSDYRYWGGAERDDARPPPMPPAA